MMPVIRPAMFRGEQEKEIVGRHITYQEEP